MEFIYFIQNSCFNMVSLMFQHFSLLKISFHEILRIVNRVLSYFELFHVFMIEVPCLIGGFDLFW